MNFVLLRSSAFVREARKIVKKQPNVAQNIQKALTLLTTDPFNPQLKTKLLKKSGGTRRKLADKQENKVSSASRLSQRYC